MVKWRLVEGLINLDMPTECCKSGKGDDNPCQQKARRDNPAAQPEPKAEWYGGVSDYGGHRMKLQLKTWGYLIPAWVNQGTHLSEQDAVLSSHKKVGVLNSSRNTRLIMW